ncbi:BTAD domain-containing putative transcriptional regulator [Streptomyces sp. NPDC006487]|uniref:AfsR/SARP family transcriptional regulator n=1 Tax=Streptomyces sp. NPDC006487 TaxID=3364748 RepID=UPI0036ABD60B
MYTSESVPPAHLRLLGQFRLEYSAEPVPMCLNAQRILAFVGLHKCVSRTVLAGSLWPDVTEEHARGSLRSTLCKLPRGHALVSCCKDSISIADSVSVDAHALAETALRIVHASKAWGGGPVPMVLLNGGDLLPGWDEDWVLFERERLRQLRLHALDALAENLSREGLHALALETALTSVRIDPLRESAHRAVVSAHLAEGNLNEAVRHYRAFQQLLREELGVEPSRRFARMIPPTAVGTMYAVDGPMEWQRNDGGVTGSP